MNLTRTNDSNNETAKVGKEFVRFGQMSRAFPILLGFAFSQAIAQPTKVPTSQEIQAAHKADFKGEYFLTRTEDPICIPFTKNLNQFRKLDFDDCAPRLSPKFPEFSRPQWREVPLDLEIAEKTVKDFASEKSPSPAESYWQNWLKDTGDLRATAMVKMWLTEVDINHDGTLDPIARVQYAHPASSLPVKERSCVYSHSGLRFLSSEPSSLRDGRSHFYFGRASDIVYFSKTKSHYSVEWSEEQVGPILEGQTIGATRGVLVELARNPDSPLNPVCWINWVPTGKYHPLSRKTISSKKHR